MQNATAQTSSPRSDRVPMDDSNSSALSFQDVGSRSSLPANDESHTKDNSNATQPSDDDHVNANASDDNASPPTSTASTSNHSDAALYDLSIIPPVRGVEGGICFFADDCVR